MRRAVLQSDLDTCLAELAVTFLQRTAIAVATLPRLIERIDNGEIAVMKEIEALLHGIRGGGAMFGFPALSDQAGAFERLISDFRSGGAAPAGITAPVLRRLRQSARRLMQETDAAARETLALRR